MKKQIAIDWQKCAEALSLKLNLIGARLKELSRESISADVAFITSQLLEEFKLDTDQKFICLDVAEMQRKIDCVRSMLTSARFAGLSSRDKLLSDSCDLLGSLSFDFSVLAAFSLEAGSPFCFSDRR